MSKLKEYTVMAEVTIATTFHVKAADEDNAQVLGRQGLEEWYRKMPTLYFDPETDDLKIEIGDAEEA